jgi:anti-sigma regulatory factor (Ser/Thr protein kinase)
VTSSRRFRCQPEAVTAARRFVRDALGDQSLQVAEAAELMASEVATNCVRHARTDFELTIHTRGQIRIEVRDTGSGRPTLLSPPPRELSGRGLRIVEAMSDAWGVIPASDGKTVWFTVAQPGSASEESSSAASSARASKASDQPAQRASRHLRRSLTRSRSRKPSGASRRPVQAEWCLQASGNSLTRQAPTVCFRESARRPASLESCSLRQIAPPSVAARS